MSQFKLTGTLKAVNPKQTFGNFTKRSFHLAQSKDEYPNTWEVTLTQNNTALISQFKVGDVITCHCELDGKEWTKDGVTKAFNTVRCWKIELVSNAVVSEPVGLQQPEQPEQIEDFGDLPF